MIIIIVKAIVSSIKKTQINLIERICPLHHKSDVHLGLHFFKPHLLFNSDFVLHYLRYRG
jgi:hypothetical protein